MVLSRSRLRLRELSFSASSSFYYCYSATSASAATNGVSPHFMADYLVTSLGFSKEEAILASAKVSHLKCGTKPDFMINLLKKYGLDQSQIKNLVSSVPGVLLHSPGETLESKFRLLQELGLSGSDLVRLIKRYPDLFTRALDTHFIPIIKLLRNILGSDENVLKAINKSAWVFSYRGGVKNIPLNMSLLQNHGFSNEKIVKFVCRYPRTFMYDPERMKSALDRLEGELKIPGNSPMFFLGVHVLTVVSWSFIEKKFEIFRSFGWSDSDILTVARRNPFCLGMSADRIHRALNFFMTELGYTPSDLASRPTMFMYALEKRVKPRYKVLNILKEKKLLDCNPNLFTAVNLSEFKFVEKFVVMCLPLNFWKFVAPASVKGSTKEVCTAGKEMLVHPGFEDSVMLCKI